MVDSPVAAGGACLLGVAEAKNLVPTVLVMLKAPRPGEVKTRLAVDVGEVRAARIYRRLVERQLAAIPEGWPVEVHFAPAEAGEEMRAWIGPRPCFWPQTPGDLGRRLDAAVRAAFAREAAAVLVIGGDCPDLDRRVLRSAAVGLGAHDVVLGPAADGGYYLIGLKRPHPSLFTGIPWSTDQVFVVTLRESLVLGLVVLILSVLDDVDTLADYQKHAASLAAGDPIPDGGPTGADSG